MKKFSKIKFLQTVGLLDRKLDIETFRLKVSRLQELYCYICLILKLAHCAKLPVSLIWPREDPAQVFVGNFFNYLDVNPRFWLALTVSNLKFAANQVSVFWESKLVVRNDD